MLSVGQLSEGFVLDHIQAGKSMEIYRCQYCEEIYRHSRKK